MSVLLSRLILFTYEIICIVMGNEQSFGESRLGLQRNEELRSCTTSKPIGTDSAQNSPRLLVKNKLAPKNLPINKIVVVAEGVSESSDDIHLNKLNSIPICYPLIPINGNSVHNCQIDLNMYRLNPKNLAEISLRYQEHLKLCSERTASEQNSLCSRIKETEASILIQYTSLIEKRNRFAKYTEQIQKVNDIHSILGRIHNSLGNIAIAMEEINMCLPESERLESFRPKKLTNEITKAGK